MTRVGKRYRLHTNVFCTNIFHWNFVPIAQGGRWCFDTESEAMAYARRETAQPPLSCGGCS